MSSQSLKGRPPSRPGQGGFAGAAPNGQASLLDKANVRTSTPDSEALASSDDEGEHRQEAQPPPAQKPVRRASWLNDTSQPLIKPRKGSFASNPLSPTTSHPSTPSAESNAGSWSAAHTASSILGRPSAPSSLSWGTGIWNNERKDVPSRLTEVLPSPTSILSPGGPSNSFFAETASLSRDAAANSQIPFAIPLHPTPKTYRSQSYSVGQLEPDPGAPTTTGVSSSAVLGRARHPALQHRPSRPSMLSEMANDGSMLGKVKEVEDDDEEQESPDPLQTSFHQSSESQTIEMLTRENALLRQQQQQQQHVNRLRSRASVGSGYLGNGYSVQESVPEEADYAVDEMGEGALDNPESYANRNASRRMSEYAAGAGAFRAPLSLERGKTDSSNLKKAIWSTAMGFPALDGSQSRRHSFANMPTRQGSISSLADSNVAGTLDMANAELHASHDYGAAIPEDSSYAGPSNTYFTGGPPGASSIPPSYATSYTTFNTFANRPPSPHRNVYGMGQPRQSQLLHVVLFKCARADVFYIQEGTGLSVKPGDLVIVEADRGTDLGTVAKDNVDWHTAKEAKEHYAEEHYKWLMMYSQGAAAASESSGAGLLASAGGGLQGNALGGMGGPANQPQHHMQEANSGELRPKLIKRLAQSHEVHSLREKEGQEAKAKRVCMQKVKEHGLNMEILDAEFQMDWKKLTFYYFADAYINFNSLVTDLFKIYKTRIWMYAINPASFASPTLGIQAPSGIGPGAVNAGRGGSGNSDRRQNQQTQRPGQPLGPGNQSVVGVGGGGGGGGAAQAYRPSFSDPFGAERQMPPQPAFAMNYGGYSLAGPFGVPRPNAMFVPGMPSSVDGYPGVGFQSTVDYQTSRHRFPTPGSIPSPNPHSQDASPLVQSGDWNGAFQSLSLNTH